MSAHAPEAEGAPTPSEAKVILGGGGTPPPGGRPSSGDGGGTEPPVGLPLVAFISAVGHSVATAAQDLRSKPAPAGAPGVELRGASLTIKGIVTWDEGGSLRLRPAKPGDADSVVSQVLLTYEPVPRLTAPTKTGSP